eukprot:CAMPEP_0194143098 /NCGR_PEP_ID=MMETSP0152-20130528/12301_1 /TAXON_ID=1049557 /ORGANISM="Thalassiothrix antarctica, Strain L6-D1" /LENGTH=189 /DNA_ID=CAMNT_0038842353 /DNA_START=289 /DNA_END=855 /DNA_ORIENTATION=-
MKTSAIATSDLTAAKAFIDEQKTAQGNFPGPCPVIYTGEDIENAIKAGITAVITDDYTTTLEGIDIIYKVESPEQVAKISGNAFFVYGSADNQVGIINAIPKGSVILASVEAMQNDNNELERAKELQSQGVTAVLMEKACIGDNEDIEYSTFVIDGLTKKRSSTFNMSGLTGSTNGHFGGIAQSTSKSW